MADKPPRRSLWDQISSVFRGKSREFQQNVERAILGRQTDQGIREAAERSLAEISRPAPTASEGNYFIGVDKRTQDAIANDKQLTGYMQRWERGSDNYAFQAWEAILRDKYGVNTRRDQGNVNFDWPKWRADHGY